MGHTIFTDVLAVRRNWYNLKIMSNKIKVLMVGPDRSVHGGVSGVVNQFFDAGLAERVQIKYIGTMKDGTKLKKLLVAIVAYARFFCCVHNYDIVHIHMSSDSSYLRKSFFIKNSKKAGKKLVLQQHGGDIQNYYLKLDEKRKCRFKEILSMPDTMLVLGVGLKIFFDEILTNHNIKVFYNSIKIPETYSKDYSNNNILFLGRLCKDKGLRELFSAMKKVVAVVPDAHLYLGGIWEDKELEILEREIKAHISFVGWVDGREKEELLEKCSVFVLPSYYEGQPISVMEAMTHSLTVVATTVGSIPEMITSKVSGELVTPRDENALSEALIRVLTDIEYKKQLAMAGRRIAENIYDINVRIDELCDIYKEILTED